MFSLAHLVVHLVFMLSHLMNPTVETYKCFLLAHLVVQQQEL
jgi:hypothetical protein